MGVFIDPDAAVVMVVFKEIQVVFAGGTAMGDTGSARGLIASVPSPLVVGHEGVLQGVLGALRGVCEGMRGRAMRAVAVEGGLSSSFTACAVVKLLDRDPLWVSPPRREPRVRTAVRTSV